MGPLERNPDPAQGDGVSKPVPAAANSEKGWELKKNLGALLIGGGLGYLGSIFLGTPLKYYADQFHNWLIPAKIKRVILVPDEVYVGDIVRPQVEFESLLANVPPGRVTFRLKNEVGEDGPPLRESNLSQTVKVSTASSAPFPDANAPQFRFDAVARGNSKIWATYTPDGGVPLELAKPLEIRVQDPYERLKVSHKNHTGQWRLVGPKDSYIVKLVVLPGGEIFGKYVRESAETTPAKGTIEGIEDGQYIRLTLTRADTREASIFESRNLALADNFAKYTGTLRAALPTGLPNSSRVEDSYELFAPCDSGCESVATDKK